MPPKNEPARKSEKVEKEKFPSEDAKRMEEFSSNLRSAADQAKKEESEEEARKLAWEKKTREEIKRQLELEARGSFSSPFSSSSSSRTIYSPDVRDDRDLRQFSEARATGVSSSNGLVPQELAQMLSNVQTARVLPTDDYRDLKPMLRDLDFNFSSELGNMLAELYTAVAIDRFDPDVLLSTLARKAGTREILETEMTVLLALYLRKGNKGVETIGNLRQDMKNVIQRLVYKYDVKKAGPVTLSKIAVVFAGLLHALVRKLIQNEAYPASEGDLAHHLQYPGSIGTIEAGDVEIIYYIDWSYNRGKMFSKKSKDVMANDTVKYAHIAHKNSKIEKVPVSGAMEGPMSAYEWYRLLTAESRAKLGDLGFVERERGSSS